MRIQWLQTIRRRTQKGTGSEQRQSGRLIRSDYQLILRTGLKNWSPPASLGYSLSVFANTLRKYWLGLIDREYRYAR